MSKIELSPLSSGFATTAALNQRLQLIEDALNNDVLYRANPDGEPNSMEQDLDMDDNRIINLPDAITDQEPATLGQLIAAVEVNNSFSERVANTVADLFLLNAQVGERVLTKGCRAVADRGHGEFIIESASGTPDGFYRVSMSNGNHAVLQPDDDGCFNLLQLGAVADGVTDNSSAFALASDLGISIKIPAGNFLSTAGLVLDGVGLKLKGEGRDISIITADFISGAAVRLMSQYQTLSDLSIAASASRSAAAYTSNGFGIHVETSDVADDANITRQRGVVIENVEIEGQTGAAVYLVGPVIDGGAIRNIRCLNNKGHGLAIDRGFLGGRVNKAAFPSGVINIDNMLSFGNTGHAVALGHKDDTTTTQTVRVIVDNLDANVSSMVPAQLYNAVNSHGIWVAGSNIEVINSVVTGSGTQYAAFVKGTNNSFRNLRQIETAATLEVGDNVAGLPTRDITLDGVNVINTTAQTNAVVLGSATDIQDINIRIDNLSDITNIVDTTAIRGLRLNNPTFTTRSVSSTVYNNTTTATPINNLAYRAAAGEEFRFTAGIFYDGDAAADLRITVGSTASISSIQFGPTGGTKVGSSLSVDVIAAVTALNSPISLGCDGSKRYFEFSGHVVNGASAATITINAAQLAAVAANTTVHAGSYFTVEKLIR